MISKTRFLDKYSYFLSNPSAFFYRFADTGFKNKWTGFWATGTKFLEFFDFKIGEEFLSEKNCISTYFDFIKAIHSHELSDNSKITQKAWMPRKNPFLILELSSKKKLNARFEAAINIRSINENTHKRKYKLKNGKRLRVQSDLGKVVFSVLKGKHSFKENPRHRFHWPAGEKQSIFSPGHFNLSGKRIVLQVAARKFFKPKKNDLLHNYKALKKKSTPLHSNNPNLNTAIERAIKSMDLLQGKNSFFAGFPWFQQYWARDVFWSLPALIECGFFKEARNSLKFFARHSQGGKIPNYLFQSNKTLNSIDATPLFLIALEHYLSYSNDLSFLKKMKKPVLNALSFLKSKQDESDGFIAHDQNNNETWMDTLNRGEKAVEVQALFIKALESIPLIASHYKRTPMGLAEQAIWSKNQAIELRKEFDSSFFKNGFFADRLIHNKPDFTPRANALVPLFLGVSEREEVLNAFESDEFFTEKGIASLSKNHASFSPESYHQGKVWSLVNGWMCGTEFLFNRPEQGWRFFDLIALDQERDALGCIGECWNPVTQKQTGCSNQLWGNAMLVRAFYEFALGLNVNAGNKLISLKPRLNERVPSLKLKLRVGKKEGVLRVDLERNKAVFSIPGYRVELE